jgi:hypothetical protein
MQLINNYSNNSLILSEPDVLDTETKVTSIQITDRNTGSVKFWMVPPLHDRGRDEREQIIKSLASHLMDERQ